MRYLVGFVLFALALGTLRMVGCGDEGEPPEPCEGVWDCDERDACTIVRCDTETKTCRYAPVDCRDTECKSFAFDVCDPEATTRSPRDGALEVCGAVTIHEGRSCRGGGSCTYWDISDDCYFYVPWLCEPLRTGSYKCSSSGICTCQ